MVLRAGCSSNGYKDVMSIPKEVLPKSSSFMSGIIVLAEGVLDHLLCCRYLIVIIGVVDRSGE